MSKTSKKLTVIIICLLAVTFGLLYNKTTITSFLTDSGFDSSYGGGHSHSSVGGHSHSSGGGSYHRSSGGSSHSSYHSSSSSSSGDASPLFLFLVFVIVVLIVLTPIAGRRSIDRATSSLPPLRLNKNKAWTKDKFASIVCGIDLFKFLFERTADLVQIQYHWMNFNYDKLREKLTDELYNQYEMQLKTLSMKGQKNVMKNFNTIDYMVTNATNDNGRYTVTMEVIISFIDYIEKNGKAVRGSSKKPITMHYELVFTSSSDGIVDKCPQCGAQLNDTTTQICPYCRHQITQDSTKWVMSKKIAKGQR